MYTNLASEEEYSMGFLEHLQSSLILGTALDQPISKNFELERIQTFFDILEANKRQELFKMIESGFDIDTPHHKSHETALITAIRLGLESLAIELITYGASIIVSNKTGESPLYLSLKHKLNAVSELLINLDGFKTQSVAMQRACSELLRQRGIKSTIEVHEYFQPKISFFSDVFTAAKKGEVQQIIRLLNGGVSLHITNSKRQSLLHIAIMSGSIALVSYLLNRGIHIDGKDKFGNSPLLYASMFKKRIPILELLIKHGATLDQQNYSEHSALTMAIRKQNIDAINILCKAGVNLNHRDGIHTPLSLLHDQIHATHNETKLTELRRINNYFMVHGAHVNAIGDKIGWIPLQLTVNYYDSPFYLAHLQKLIDLGANINYRDVVDRTALMLAAGLGRIQSVKLLIKHGAYIDYEDKYGWTALMLAVYNNQIDIVTLLLDSGANINLTSSKQLSALKIAIDQKNRVMEEFLRDNGAILDK